MSNAPVIDTVGTPVSDTVPAPPEQPRPAAPPANVQQLTVADIIARVHTLLKEDYEMDVDDIAKIEQLGQVQVGSVTWVAGRQAPPIAEGQAPPPFHVLAMYQGESNERTAEYMQGDVRVYLIPLTVVAPGARDYRRYTFNMVVNKTITHRMTLDAFVEAVAFEELTVADDTGLLGEEEETT